MAIFLNSKHPMKSIREAAENRLLYEASRERYKRAERDFIQALTDKSEDHMRSRALDASAAFNASQKLHDSVMGARKN